MSAAGFSLLQTLMVYGDGRILQRPNPGVAAAHRTQGHCPECSPESKEGASLDAYFKAK
jgi:hypothetical protein